MYKEMIEDEDHVIKESGLEGLDRGLESPVAARRFVSRTDNQVPVSGKILVDP